MTGSSERGFDLAHDALVRARRKHARFEPGRPMRPWLMTNAKNLWRSQLRSPWARVRDTVRALADTLRSPSDVTSARAGA